jgi:redox-sensitive bicupin YhaK (pirin superfamily)
LRDHFVATVGPSAGQGRPLASLLVLADATFAPHSRFPLHPHQEMEILSIVIDGTLSHHGDQANGASLGPRSAQLISARNGIVHAEGNDTDTPTRMLQLWFQPDRHGGAPEYFSRQLGGVGRELVAGDEQMPLRADAKVWWLTLPTDSVIVKPGRIRVGANVLQTGDGGQLGQGEFSIEGTGSALLIDLPSK